MLTVLCVLVGASLFGFFIYKSVGDAAPQFDKVTFCPPKVPSVTAVLVDGTDVFSAVQRAAIRSRLDAVKEVVPKRGRIDLYAIGEEQDGLPRALMSVCNPGTAEEADKFTENAALVKKRWTRDFSDKLDQELGNLLETKEAAISPIMEAVQAIAIQSFGAAETRDAVEKRFVIVSDLLQYTKEYSQYQGVKGDAFGAFSKSDYYRKVRPDLRGADVEILYVRRSTKNNVQGKEHLLFWEKFIDASNGHLVHYIPIEG